MKHRSILGWALIVVGGILLLNALNITDISIGAGVAKYWPIFLILIGIFFVYKVTKTIAYIGIIVLLALALFFFVGKFTADARPLVQRIPFEDVDLLHLDLNFGAGELTVRAGDQESLVLNKINTTGDDPQVDVSSEGRTATVEISTSESTGFSFRKHNTWHVDLAPGVPLMLDLDYGAAAAELDLRGLTLQTLDLDTGASATRIWFDSATTTNIDTGASSLEFLFPDDAAVRVEVDGGAISTNFPDFEEDDGVFTYNSNAENLIELSIDAGASSIEGTLYQRE